MSSCDDLFHMKNGESCKDKWEKLRDVIHPCQEAVGFSAVERKIKKDYMTEQEAQSRMNEPGSTLPFVLGPKGIPYLIDSHHTTSALEASGHHGVRVTLKKVCDWSNLPEEDFNKKMLESNFMVGIGREGSDPNTLPVQVDVNKAIPSKIVDLKDDPWRSFGALVRKVKDDSCPPDNTKCLRGYFRECKEDGSMTAFFEFRWAYFMNEAYNRGCKKGSYWDHKSDCKKFQSASKALLQKDVGSPILAQDAKAWEDAAKLLVPLCRGKEAQNYTLPVTLGKPMAGEKLPGSVSGKGTHITEEDPTCKAPTCPAVPSPLDFLSTWWKK